MTARAFLVRGLLAGLLAGFAAFLVAHQVGEPHVERAIALEEAARRRPRPHAHADEPPTAATADEDEGTVVSRANQRTWGLLTGTARRRHRPRRPGRAWSRPAVVGRIGRLGPRPVDGAGRRWSASSRSALVPFLKYPATPPAVGNADTIGNRTGRVLRVPADLASPPPSLRPCSRPARCWQRYGGVRRRARPASAAYLVVVVVAGLLMPTVNEVGDFPADTLWYFRRASLFTLATLWAVIGVVLTGLVGRLFRAEDAALRAPRAGRQPVITAAIRRRRRSGPAAAGRSGHAARRARAARRPGRLAGGDQGGCRRAQLDDVRLVIFAGDHGVARARRLGVPARDHRAPWSARSWPGKAAVSALARAARRPRCGCSTSASTTTWPTCPAEVRRYKVRRGTGPIHLEDALTADGDPQGARGRFGRRPRGDRRPARSC